MAVICFLKQQGRDMRRERNTGERLLGEMIGTGVVIPLWTLAGRKATKKNGTGWLR
jgi:hypothetical protein